MADAAVARILERQKMLQTGQVLLRRLSVDFALVLPFKDSSEAAEPRCSTPIAIKLPDSLAGLRRRLARRMGALWRKMFAPVDPERTPKYFVQRLLKGS
jgi:hypothetical protein